MKKYQIPLREKVIVLLISLGVAGLVAHLFYHSIWGMVITPGMYVLVKKIWIEKRQRVKKQHVKEHFMHGLQVLNVSLQAGFSLENAWKEVEKETLLLHKESSEFYQAIRQMNRSVTLNMPVEQLFSQVAYGFAIEELISFAQIMEFGKKSGGDWKHIIEDTVLRMLERYEAQKEIEIMVAGKKMEQQVMNVIPLGMLLFLQISSWDYICVLYESVLGVLIMTICLGIYGFAMFLSEKIMDVQV